ncbi:MAG: carboxypeptidase-like regulatory domain-containing protein [Bacteroidales bacterium]|nr:carboxypeptidase-like regulatory domain-containing protein [Bacteroidales bacterium]
MLSNGSILKRFPAIVILILIAWQQRADCQRNILDSTFTFRAGTVKTGNALEIIRKHTGYNFTYDSRLIDEEEKTEMTFRDTKLEVILKNILHKDSLSFSVIDKFIIISYRKKELPSPPADRSSITDKINYLTGRIVDDETNEPLPFATIAIKNKGKGTITNNNGEFGLKITSDLMDDTLSVSYLGYVGRELHVKEALADNKISLKKEFIPIPDIIIRNQRPQDIILKARSSISSNYGNTPASMAGFYREGILKRNELKTYSEAVLKIYKSPYTGTLLSDQIKVLKSRKIETTGTHDTLSVSLKAGLSTCLELDGAKNIYDFISIESIQDYRYRITDIVTYDEEQAYVIEFEQRENITEPLYKGTIYINTYDFGILHAEFEVNPSLIHKMKNSFISNQTRGFDTWPVSVKYSVSYRKVNDRYFLSHVRGDLLLYSNQKRRLFKSQFKVFFELAITDIDLKNVTRFEREERAPIYSIFSKTIKNYDPSFWENQNFLRPEDDLLQALKNMNVRLQEAP